MNTLNCKLQEDRPQICFAHHCAHSWRTGIIIIQEWAPRSQGWQKEGADEKDLRRKKMDGPDDRFGIEGGGRRKRPGCSWVQSLGHQKVQEALTQQVAEGRRCWPEAHRPSTRAQHMVVVGGQGRHAEPERPEGWPQEIVQQVAGETEAILQWVICSSDHWGWGRQEAGRKPPGRRWDKQASWPGERHIQLREGHPLWAPVLAWCIWGQSTRPRGVGFPSKATGTPRPQDRDQGGEEGELGSQANHKSQNPDQNRWSQESGKGRTKSQLGEGEGSKGRAGQSSRTEGLTTHGQACGLHRKSPGLRDKPEARGCRFQCSSKYFFYIQRCDRVTGKVHISHPWGLFDPRLDASWKGHAEHTESSPGALDQRTFRVHSTLRHQFSPTTLCDPTDYSPPGSSVIGILQARILEWVASPFSRGSSQPRDQIKVSHIAGGPFTLWATREAPLQPVTLH